MNCQICESSEKLQLHHDSYDPEKTRVLCVPCHQKQHIGHGVGVPIGWSSKFLENKDTFSRMWDDSFTYNELMNWFEISFVTVYNWAKRLNKAKRLEPRDKTNSNNDCMMQCRVCGGTDLRRNGFILTTKGKKQRFQCKSCGSTAIEAKLRINDQK